MLYSNPRITSSALLAGWLGVFFYLILTKKKSVIKSSSLNFSSFSLRRMDSYYLIILFLSVNAWMSASFGKEHSLFFPCFHDSEHTIENYKTTYTGTLTTF